VTWYLMAALYVIAALASSVVFVHAIAEAVDAGSPRDLDRQDWATAVALTLLWPLVWLAAGWRVAYVAHTKRVSRRRTAALLAVLGATTEAEEKA
jgi:hypothetical protein